MTEIQQAINLVKQGRRNEARPILEGLIRSNPHDATAWIWYAATLDSVQKQVQLLEACLKQNPGDPQVIKTLDALRFKSNPGLSAPSTPVPPPSFPASKPKQAEPPPVTGLRYDDEYLSSPSFSESMGWDDQDRPAAGSLPNIRVPANEKVLAYLKSQSSYHELIVPFSFDKVNQNRVHSDFMSWFSAMSSLPQNSKYVIHGFPALAHPKTGVICGFTIGTSVLSRLPENIVDEFIANRSYDAHRVSTMKDSEISILENNWLSSWSITEKLVNKCFEYYGKDQREQMAVRLNIEEDLTKPPAPRSILQTLVDKVVPTVVGILICLVVLVIAYFLNSLGAR